MKAGEFIIIGKSSIEMLGYQDYVIRTRASNGELIYKKRLIGYTLKEARQIVADRFSAGLEAFIALKSS